MLRAGRSCIDADYAGDGSRLLAIGPAFDGGSVHSTQKSPGLALNGQVEAGGCPTAWRWISAHGTGLGFKLQSGYFGDAENALWLGGQLLPLGPLQVEVEPSGCWALRTVGGLLDLRFTPEGTRCDDKQLLVASSRMRQHAGRFDGWVKGSAGGPCHPVSGLVGLAEDYRARW